MEKLPMCRLCLAENVCMYVVVNKNLHELYERLTDNPFVTEDSRPMLACFICCTKLKQCYQLQRKCLEAEELLTRMMNEDYELNPLRNQDHFGSFNGLILSPMVHVSIESDDKCQTESDAVKEELPAVCERLDDVIEPKEERQSDELELERLSNSYSETEDVLAQQSESDSEDYIPLIKIKMEVEEEQEVSRKKRRVSDTTRAAIAKKRKLYVRGKTLEDVITANQKKTEEPEKTVTQNTESGSSTFISKFQEPFTNATPRVNISVIDTTLNTNCRSNIKKRNLTKHIRVHTGEKPYKCEECKRFFSQKINLIRHINTHTGEKPYKCEECQLSFSQKSGLTNHIRAHTSRKVNKCDICQRCFKKKSHLTSHIRTHTGEKPFKCDICQSCFSEKSFLKNHMRRHTGDKRFKCEVCQRRFINKCDLINHNRTHTGEKPFKCDICQRCFTQNGQFKNHVRRHAGEKPFKCDICQRCFSKKVYLINHIRTHTS